MCGFQRRVCLWEAGTALLRAAETVLSRGLLVTLPTQALALQFPRAVVPGLQPGHTAYLLASVSPLSDST